ncbi:MFS general substrate transporter [Penicillium taxi]|uniref:MFS general substrate transporter n=1 Tax=Penicillium taxi TaxID=168475 RepID=UPI002545B5BA|nr:MFS general substrate transporter [Penicillium taxi]KAJ5901969.1 MFS general substrate transporter [Penicillium taxi]
MESLGTSNIFYSTTVMEAPPIVTAMEMVGVEEENDKQISDLEACHPERINTGILNVITASLGLFSDGYNAQISRYKGRISSTVKSRLFVSYFFREVSDMLFFGVLVDRIGRRTGIMLATSLFLALFWILLPIEQLNSVAQGIVGFGAEGEYPVCASTCEAAD